MTGFLLLLKIPPFDSLADEGLTFRVRAYTDPAPGVEVATLFAALKDPTNAQPLGMQDGHAALRVIRKPELSVVLLRRVPC